MTVDETGGTTILPLQPSCWNWCSKELRWMPRPDHGQGNGPAGRAGLSADVTYYRLSPSSCYLLPEHKTVVPDKT